MSVDASELSGQASGLAGVPLAANPLTRKDFVAEEPRWCPGCGDFSILAAFQQVLPELGIARENTMIVSGIGCSSRFPYYLNSYGIHSIHGRAITLATGLAVIRPDLAVFVVTGDGDALSIGGNHLLHALRRNVNITVLLFNNRIYGLTKGQYSPTSQVGQVTKSSPMGAPDRPVNPVSYALGAEATFVARSLDSDRKHLVEVLGAATRHRGASLVEIYQNCSVFNDGAFEALKGPGAADNVIPLVAGEPIRFGTENQLCVVADAGGGVRVADVADVNPSDIIVHDPTNPDPSRAFALSRLTDSGVMMQAPMGIFRDVEAPAYDDEVRAQVDQAVHGEPNPTSDSALQKLLTGSDTWQVD